jgi:hypothetical protein
MRNIEEFVAVSTCIERERERERELREREKDAQYRCP